MQCDEARALLQAGIRPGSRSPQQAALGFHLAGCADCRQFRDRLPAAAPITTPAGSAAQARATQPLQPAEPEYLDRAAPAAALAEPQSEQAYPVTPVPAVPPVAELPAIPQRRSQPAAVARAQAAWPLRRSAGAGRSSAPRPKLRHPLARLIRPIGATLAGMLIGLLLIAAVQAVRTYDNLRAMQISLPSSSPLAGNMQLASSAVPVPSSTALPLATPLLSPTPLPPDPGGPLTVLLLGLDRRPGESAIPRTDALMLVRIEPASQRVALLSLSRDLWVSIPNYGAGRVNAAYVYGESSTAGLGPAWARDTISNLLGISIDYVVVIDFEGLIGLVDSLGGVTLEVEKELYDNAFPTMDYGYQIVHFLPGAQLMDGNTALIYSRIRHPDSDFERIKRQQAVLQAIGLRLRELNAVETLASAERVTNALRAYVRTDLPPERLLGVVWALRDIDAATIERYSINEQLISFGVGADQYAQVLLPGVAEQLRKQLLGGSE